MQPSPLPPASQTHAGLQLGFLTLRAVFCDESLAAGLQAGGGQGTAGTWLLTPHTCLFIIHNNPELPSPQAIKGTRNTPWPPAQHPR